VEYAILFIVLSILFIGGAELGMAALASYKNTDAAKTGVSEYVEVNQRRLNILNAEKRYSLALRSSLTSESCVNIVGKGSNDDGLSSDSDQFKCSVDPEYQLIFSDYIDFLDAINNVVGLTEYALKSTSLSNHDDKLIEFDDFDPDVSLSDIELQIAEQSLSNPPVFDSEDTNEEKQKKISERLLKLLLIQHIKLSRLPLEVGEKLSQSKIAIGDHASNLAPPNCNDGIYDYGFPKGDVDVDGDGDFDGRYIAATGEGHKVYLFNPLPIDFKSCEGSDASRGGRSRLSILVGGYSDLTDPSKNEPGLPKLNQAMYGMYNQSRDNNLNPPGNLCTHDDCPNQSLIDGAIGPTGYYRWNKGSDGSGPGDLFKYTINNVEDELLNGFRPTMQLDCSATPNFRGEIKDGSGNIISSGNIHDPLCQNAYSKVRLHTRYRKVFEGFLTLGLQELNVSEDQVQDALKLFYNPNQVGVEGSSNIVGSVASEVGPIGRNRLPTIKPHKDFRGCYEVDVETNQVSACN